MTEDDEQVEQLDERFDRVTNGLAENDKNDIKAAFGLSIEQMVSPQAEFMKKINEKHISTYLDLQNKDMEYSYKADKNNKIMIFALAFLLSVVGIIIIILLKDQPDILEKILYAVGGLIAGGVGGYGIGRTRE